MANVEALEIQVDVQQAIRSLQRFEQRMNTLPRSLTNLNKNIDRVKRSLGGLGRAFTSPIRAITGFRGAILGLASAFAIKEFVNFGANFSFQVAKLRAVTGASAREINVLRRAIEKTGETTQFTATQSAQASVIMATLGKTARQVAKDLPMVVKSAGATDTSIQMMAESIGSAQNIFKITAKEAGNVFARAMSKSRLNVELLSIALRGVGSIAKESNLSFQQTAGILGFLADQGIEASTAGIALRNSIQYLNSTTNEGEKAFQKLGIRFKDIRNLPLEDKFVAISKGLEGIPQQAEKMAILTKIFRKETTPAVLALMNEYRKGNRVIETQNQKLSEGADVAKMYSIMMDTLQGDLISLGSVIQGKLLEAFTVLERMFRDLTQSASELVKGIDGKTIAINVLLGAKAIVVFAKTVVKSLATTSNAFQQLENWILWVGGMGKQLGAIFSTMGNLITNGLKIAFLEFRAWLGSFMSSVFDMIDDVMLAVEKYTGKDFGTKGRQARRKGQRLQESEDLAFARLDYQTALETDRASFKEGSAMKQGGTSALAGIAPALLKGLEFSEGKIEEYLKLAEDYINKQKEAEEALKKINSEEDQVSQKKDEQTKAVEKIFQLNDKSLLRIQLARDLGQVQLAQARDIAKIKGNALTSEFEKQKQINDVNAEAEYLAKQRQAYEQAGIAFGGDKTQLEEDVRQKLETQLAVLHEQLGIKLQLNKITSEQAEAEAKASAESSIRNRLAGGNQLVAGVMQYGAGGMAQGAKELGTQISAQGLVGGMAQGAMAGGPMGAVAGGLMALIEKLDIFQTLMDMLGDLIEIVNAVLRPFNKILQSLRKPIQALADVIDILLSVLDPFIETFDELMTVLSDLMRTLAVVLKPLFRIIMFVMQPLLLILKPIMEFLIALMGGAIDSMGGAVQSDDARIETLESAVATLEGLAEVLQDADQALKNIESTVRNLMYGDLSILSGQEKLLEAEKDYARFLKQAQTTGTAEDVQQFTSFINTYLSIAQGIEKSSKAYQTRYEQVMSDLEGLESTVEQRGKNVFDSTNESLEKLGLTTIAWGETLDQTSINIQSAIESIQSEIESLQEKGQQNQTQEGEGIDLASMLGNFAQSIITAIVEGISGIAQFAGQIITGIVDAIAEGFSKIGNLGTQILSGIIDAISQISLNAGQFLLGILQPIFKIGADAGAFMAGILSPITKIMNDFKVSDFITGIFSPIVAIADKLKIADFLKSIFKPITDLADLKLSDFLSNIFEPLSSLTATLSDLLTPIFKPFEKVTAKLSDLLGEIFKPFEKLTGKISDLLGEIFAPFADLTGTIDDLLGGIFEPFEDLTDGASKMFSAILKALGLDKVTDFLDTLVKRLLKALGLGSMDKEIVILPGSLLGLSDPLLAIHFKWGDGEPHEAGDGGYVKYAKGGDVIDIQKYAGGGGLAVGPSHQSGMLGMTKKGTPFLFEGGEYIINKKSADKLGKSRLDRLNSFGGGGHTHDGWTPDWAFPSENLPMHMNGSDADARLVDAKMDVPDWIHRLFGGSDKVGLDAGIRTNLAPFFKNLSNGNVPGTASSMLQLLQMYLGMYLGPAGQTTLKLPNFADGGWLPAHVHVNNVSKDFGFKGSAGGYTVEAGVGATFPELWKSRGPYLDFYRTPLDDETVDWNDADVFQKLLMLIHDPEGGLGLFQTFSLDKIIDGLGYLLTPGNWDNIIGNLGNSFFLFLNDITGGLFNPFGLTDEDRKGWFGNWWGKGGKLPSYGKGGSVYPFPASIISQMWDKSIFGEGLERNKYWKPFGSTSFNLDWKGIKTTLDDNMIGDIGRGLIGIGDSPEVFPKVVYRALFQGDDFNIEQMVRDFGGFAMGLGEGLAEGQFDPRNWGGMGARKVAWDWYRNHAHKGSPIPSREKKILARAGVKSSTLNRAKIAWGVPPPGREWINMLGMHPGAVAMDDFIGFSERPSFSMRYQPGYMPFLELLAHELRHTEQYQEAGGGSAKKRIYNFIPKYIRNKGYYEHDANLWGNKITSRVPLKDGFVRYGRGGSVGGYPFPAQESPPPSYVQSGSGITESDLSGTGSEVDITASLLDQMNSSLTNATVYVTDYSSGMIQSSYVLELMTTTITSMDATLKYLGEQTLPGFQNVIVQLIESLTGDGGFIPQLMDKMFGENGLVPTLNNQLFGDEGFVAQLLKAIGPEEGGLVWAITNKLVPAIKEIAEEVGKIAGSQTGGLGILGGGYNRSDFGRSDVGKVVGSIFSDRRVKRGITSYGSGGGVGEMLSKLTPYKFSYAGGGGIHSGVMAQDMERSAFGKQFVMNTPAGKMISGDVLGPVLSYASGGMVDYMPTYQTGGMVGSLSVNNSEVKSLLRQLINEVRNQSRDTHVSVYADLDGQVENKISDFRSEIRERVSRGQEQFA